MACFLGVFASCEGPTGVKGPEGEKGLQGDQGARGDQGDRGPQGEKGEAGPEGPEGPQGPGGKDGEPGEQGDKGKTGTSIKIADTLESRDLLPEPPEKETDAYLIEGDLWVWNIDLEEWENLGNIQGPPGEPGLDGEEGDPGTGNIEVDVVTVTYELGDYSVLSNGATSLDHKLVAGAMLRAPAVATSTSAVAKYFYDYPIAEGLYRATTNTLTTTGLPYTLAWVDEDDNAFDFNRQIDTDVTVYAKWTPPAPVNLDSQSGGNIVEKALAYIGTTTGYYLLVLADDVDDVAPTTAISAATRYLTIIGVDKEPKTISMGSTPTNGSLFTLSSSTSSLTLEKITLEGKTGNNAPLVSVSGTALFTMNDSVIKGNDNAATTGDNTTAGVLVNNARFVMNNSKIIDNSVNIASTRNTLQSKAVYVYGGTSAQFIMNGGEIKDNTNAGNAPAMWDVFIHENTAAVSFVVASDAVIDSFCLSAQVRTPATNVNNAKMNIANNWTGSIAGLYLRGSVAGMPVTYWKTDVLATTYVLIQGVKGVSGFADYELIRSDITSKFQRAKLADNVYGLTFSNTNAFREDYFMDFRSTTPTAGVLVGN